MDAVRHATLGDMVRCSELLGLLFSQEHDFNPDPELQRTGLKMVLDNPETGSVFVYERNGVVHGMVLILFSISTALGKKVAILEDLIVSPDLRGNGVGARLVKYALHFATEKGCGRVTLLTDHNNEKAHKFYRKYGFTQSGMVVFRRLISA